MAPSVSISFSFQQACADVRKVNGAGLAMNTNDAIADLGGMCANFLDTGGKATSETVKTSFKIILNDPRVKVVFVNIFGGLTLCDMIAEGIMLAYKELGINVPVVVRLRGTNEKIGQKMVCKEPFLESIVMSNRGNDEAALPLAFLRLLSMAHRTPTFLRPTRVRNLRRVLTMLRLPRVVCHSMRSMTLRKQRRRPLNYPG